MQFLFNADNLRENVREGWMDIFDFQYLDDKIIGGIEKNLPNVSEILRTVERKATGKNAGNISVSGHSKGGDSETQSAGTGGQSMGGRMSTMSA